MHRAQQKQRAAARPESQGAITSLLDSLLESHPDSAAALDSSLSVALARLTIHRAAAPSQLPHSFGTADADDTVAAETDAAVALRTAADMLNTVAEGPSDYWGTDIALQLAAVLVQVPFILIRCARKYVS